MWTRSDWTGSDRFSRVARLLLPFGLKLIDASDIRALTCACCDIEIEILKYLGHFDTLGSEAYLELSPRKVRVEVGTNSKF